MSNPVKSSASCMTTPRRGQEEEWKEEEAEEGEGGQDVLLLRPTLGHSGRARRSILPPVAYILLVLVHL